MMNAPLDFLNAKKQSPIAVMLRDGTEVKGKLVAFDLNINLYLEVDGAIKFIQGQYVNYMY